ncbi:mycofactocin biosynthesis peptidyl-dipeptidase MftE [Saccharopolyspora sp. ASAGF58]|uniref:mycofactocin biosynthesis peptidyl-dipeptidase MftE n=1 Tax=Saccharopolyspora sp. ASAGF58 TaxID=2719023 RepID=UPI00143FE7E9|nr:mycofactocin biosynthesis peptidyl-dipeptidase MftE [Saccharopolyspora sp. ASAGF58]QIZ38721.1 mycofactocin biosynthesis peptidyl-dipeptidase MftE [Saccharopolyspora sp. ASAGF58]
MTARLAERTWTELEPRRPVVLLPLGSCEQHGPHLPLDTDAAVATAVAERALALLRGEVDAVLAPTQNYGASGEHEGFPGTVSIGHTALHLLVVELGRSVLRWAERLVVVNGHGGNLRSLVGAVRRLRYEGRDVAWWACSGGESHGHAGRAETSLMHALRPDSVRSARMESGPLGSDDRVLERLMSVGVRAVSPNGVIGSPDGANAAEGGELLAEMSAGLAEAVRAWHVDGTGRLANASRVGVP